MVLGIAVLITVGDAVFVVLPVPLLVVLPFPVEPLLLFVAVSFAFGVALGVPVGSETFFTVILQTAFAFLFVLLIAVIFAVPAVLAFTFPFVLYVATLLLEVIHFTAFTAFAVFVDFTFRVILCPTYKVFLVAFNVIVAAFFVAAWVKPDCPVRLPTAKTKVSIVAANLFFCFFTINPPSFFLYVYVAVSPFLFFVNTLSDLF